MSHRKYIDIITLFGCFIFILAGTYLYFVRNMHTLQIIFGIVFFGMGAIAMIISLVSKQEGWFVVDSRKLTKIQKIILYTASLLFGISILIIAIVNNLHLVFKLIALIGGVFFIFGSITLLTKTFK